MVKQLIYTHMFYFAGKNVHMHDEKETDREREKKCVFVPGRTELVESRRLAVIWKQATKCCSVPQAPKVLIWRFRIRIVSASPIEQRYQIITKLRNCANYRTETYELIVKLHTCCKLANWIEQYDLISQMNKAFNHRWSCDVLWREQDNIGRWRTKFPRFRWKFRTGFAILYQENMITLEVAWLFFSINFQILYHENMVT
jgi:hypothetical protein